MVLDKADGEQSTPKWLWLHSSVKVSRRLRNPLPVDWELALYIGFGCLLVIGVYRARAMQQRRENLRHTSGSLHIDGTCRDSQISSTAVRHICTRVAFMVKVVTTRGSAEEGGFAMQNYTMLGCCTGNFDCCLRRCDCWKKSCKCCALGVRVARARTLSVSRSVIGSHCSICWYTVQLASGVGTALVAGSKASWTQFT